MKNRSSWVVLAILYASIFSYCSNPNKSTAPVEEQVQELQDSVLFSRTWKSPAVYLMGEPESHLIKMWQKMCETINPEYDHVMIPSYMQGEPYESRVAFSDLAMRGFHRDLELGDDFVLWRLNEYMPSDHEPAGEAERYELLCAQMDSLLTCYGDGTQWEYNINSDLRTEFARIRLNEYQKRLYGVLASPEPLWEEYRSWEAYSRAAYEAFDKVAMGPEPQGSSSLMAYCAFKESSIKLMSDALIQFYLRLTDPDRCPAGEEHSETTEAEIDAEFDKFISAMTEDENLYSIEERTASLRFDQKAWHMWMDSRRKVSASLSPDLRLKYDNATNNIRRRKLIDLKNRYIDDTVIGDFVLSLLLPYDCSDKELSEHDFEKLWEDGLSR